MDQLSPHVANAPTRRDPRFRAIARPTTRISFARFARLLPALPEQLRRVGWLVVALLVVIAWSAPSRVAPHVDAHLYMWLVAPLCWLVPAAVSALLLRDRRILFSSPTDILALALCVGLAQLTLSGAAGVLFGFGHSPYNHSFISIIGNVWYVASVLVAREVARWFLVRALEPRGELLSVGSTFALFWVTALPYSSLQRLADGNDAFEFTGSIVLPAAAASLLATYLSRRGGPLASITYLGTLQLVEWTSPILPDLTWPVAALIGVLVPVIGVALFEPDEEEALAAQNDGGIGYTWIGASVVLLLVIWFNTGVFGVAPALVHGHSMEPGMHTGDLVLSRPVDPDSLRVGDVIRFSNGSREVVHRIIEVQRLPDGLTFITKGDNNPAPDPPVPASAVDGKVVLHIGKAGLPAVYFKRLVTEVLQ